MRMLLKWEIGIEAGNAAIETGQIRELNTQLMEHTRPEAAYFCTENGTRTSYLFFDLTEPAQIPVIAEPLFQRLNASVEFIPVMTAEDLEKALSEVARG